MGFPAGIGALRLRFIQLAVVCTALLPCVSAGVPLLFPSVDEVTALVYEENTEALLPVQAAFPLFLCSAAEEAIELDAARKACGRKVIYTNKDSFSLTMLSLSDLGLLQPIPNPQVKVSPEGATVEVKDFGVGGLIPVGDALNVVTSAVPSNPLPAGRKLLILSNPTTTGSEEDSLVSSATSLPDPIAATEDTVGSAPTATDLVPDAGENVVITAGEGVLDSTESVSSAVNETVTETAETVTETAENAAAAVNETVVEVEENVASVANETIAEAGESVAAINETVVEAGENVVVAANETASGVGENIASVANGTTTSVAGDLVDTVNGTVAGAGDDLAAAVNGTVESGGALVDGAVDGAGDLGSAVTEGGGDLISAGTGTAEDLVATGTNVAGEAAQSVQGAAGTVLSNGEELARGFVEAGSEFGNQLVNSAIGFVETAQGVVLDLSDFDLTAALLSPDSIPSGLSFLLQVDISNLERNKVTRVTVESGGSAREIYILFDDSAPEAELSVPEKQKRVAKDAMEAEIEFQIHFNERVFPLVQPDALECNVFGEGDIADVLSPDALTDPNTILSLLNQTSIASDLVNAADECEVNIDSGGLLSFEPSELFAIGGALNFSAEYITPEFSFKDLGKVTEVSVSDALPRIVIKASFDPSDNTTVIGLGVGARTVMDFAALLNLDGSVFSFAWEQLMQWLNAGTLLAEDVIDRGRNLGTAATTAVATTIAGSVATSVGLTVAASMTGSVAGSGASAAGGTMNGAVDLLNVGQKVFLTGQLAGGSMPENFQAFADQLKWTMFDIQLPWTDDEPSNIEPVQSRRKLMQLPSLIEDQASEFVAAADSDDPRDLVKRSFFWIALFFLALLIVHLGVTAVLLLRRIRIPSILRLPRLELYFMYWAMPAIATSSAGLFNGDTGDKVLGAFLIIIFPFSFIAWHLYVLRKHFYARSVEVSKAALVFEPAEDGASTEHGEGGAEKEDTEEPSSGVWGFIKKCYSKFDQAMECLIYTPFLGRPYEEGTWVAPTGPKSMFFNRYGAMFQDFRHRPTTRLNMTYAYSEEKQTIDRGVVQPMGGIAGWENSRIGHIIQISGKVLEMGKLVFVAMLISGEDDPNNTAQAVILLVLTILYIILLRIFRPPIARWDLGMAMVGEIGDMLTYIFAILIINIGEEDQPDFMETMGIALLCFQGISFLATFLDNFFTLLDAGKAAYDACKNGNTEPPKMLDVALKAQLHNPRYLERKYYNKWVTHSLGKGVHVGTFKRAPLEEAMFGYTKPSGNGGRSASSKPQKEWDVSVKDMQVEKGGEDGNEKGNI